MHSLKQHKFVKDREFVSAAAYTLSKTALEMWNKSSSSPDTEEKRGDYVFPLLNAIFAHSTDTEIVEQYLSELNIVLETIRYCLQDDSYTFHTLLMHCVDHCDVLNSAPNKKHIVLFDALRTVDLSGFFSTKQECHFSADLKKSSVGRYCRDYLAFHRDSDAQLLALCEAMNLYGAADSANYQLFSDGRELHVNLRAVCVNAKLSERTRREARHSRYYPKAVVEFDLGIQDLDADTWVSTRVDLGIDLGRS